MTMTCATKCLPPMLPDGLDTETVMDAVERQMVSLDNPGFCLACGSEAEGCEPDASFYACAHCGEEAVHGAELLFTTYV
ncbi:MAG: hypothetical protein AAGH68_02335 [Pseudomonadota bacterium]